jgi:hypothetical protein
MPVRRVALPRRRRAFDPGLVPLPQLPADQRRRSCRLRLLFEGRRDHGRSDPELWLDGRQRPDRPTRYSCPTCNSGVFGRSEVMPDQVNLYAGSLDDTSQFKPQVAIFIRSRPAWDTSSQQLKCFEAVPLT